MKVVGDDIVLSTMGRGFWILYGMSAVREMDAATGQNAQLFSVSDAKRSRAGFSRGGSGGVSYAPTGVAINYVLPEPVSDGVSLEFRNLSGAVVARFESSEATTTRQAAEQRMRGPVFSRQAGTLPGADQGIHRFIWDMRAEGAENAEGKRQQGKMVLPGVYTVSIQAGDFRSEQDFQVLQDPATVADGVTLEDLEAQAAFLNDVEQTVTSANRALARINEVRDQEGEDSDTEQRDELDAVYDELVTNNSDSYPPPMLLSQLSYLYGNSGQADQRPGADAYARHIELKEWLDQVPGGTQPDSANR